MSVSKCCRCGVLSRTVGPHHPVCSTCLEEEIVTLTGKVHQLEEAYRVEHECARDNTNTSREKEG